MRRIDCNDALAFLRTGEISKHGVCTSSAIISRMLMRWRAFTSADAEVWLLSCRLHAYSLKTVYDSSCYCIFATSYLMLSNKLFVLRSGRSRVYVFLVRHDHVVMLRHGTGTCSWIKMLSESCVVYPLSYAISSSSHCVLQFVYAATISLAWLHHCCHRVVLNKSWNK